MTSIIIVEKNGNLKSTTVKSLSEEELYKKAGYKTAAGFEKQHVWKLTIDGKNYNVILYAKTTGRAGQENKYEFPPPVDSKLYFGNCILVNAVPSDKSEYSNLDVDDWIVIYEFLYGGFEDLGSEDSSESEDTDDGRPRTRSGYIIDDFVVEDDEPATFIQPGDDSDDNKVQVKKGKAPPKKKAAPAAKKAKEIAVMVKDADEIEELSCTSELSEEEFVEED